MATDSFGRHTRASVDAAVHHVLASLTRHADSDLFERLLRVARPRALPQVHALEALVWCSDDRVRDPERVVIAHGHPLVVADRLAQHLFAAYPVPRFLASVWFGGQTPGLVERRQAVIAHARGASLLRVALPLPLTRRMAHVFLGTPDHVPFDHALRRAEILGLGGSPRLVDAVLTTRLAEDFDDAERWRAALAWLVRCGDDVVLAQVRPLIDYLAVHLHEVDLRGRTFASALRLVRGWHGRLALARTRYASWTRSRWRPLVLPVEPTPERRAEWSIVELLDTNELIAEGRAMRHCVASYARWCAAGASSIWSLRHRWCDEDIMRSVLTIEVAPKRATIVQIRGKANAPARGEPFALVRRWAAREGLRFDAALAARAALAA